MLELNIGKRKITTDKNAFVMGILNVTPDSFFDKSRGGLDRAFKLIEEGADILDIGGESTRPGFTEVSIEDEINRIVPVIQEIRKKSDIAISVDTRKSKVLKAALNAGADILNDVSAMEDDAEIVKIAADYGCGVVLMHRFNEPEEQRKTNPQIVKIVKEYLLQRADYAVKNGVLRENIILDPGIGFGKTSEENIELIRNFQLFFSKDSGTSEFEYPYLMALSRKRCIGTMTGKPVEERMAGTLTADIISVMKGAKLIRVHDVKEAVDSLNIMKFIY